MDWMEKINQKIKEGQKNNQTVAGKACGYAELDKTDVEMTKEKGKITLSDLGNPVRDELKTINNKIEMNIGVGKLEVDLLHASTWSEKMELLVAIEAERYSMNRM